VKIVIQNMSERHTIEEMETELAKALADEKRLAQEVDRRTKEADARDQQLSAALDAMAQPQPMQGFAAPPMPPMSAGFPAAWMAQQQPAPGFLQPSPTMPAVPSFSSPVVAHSAPMVQVAPDVQQMQVQMTQMMQTMAGWQQGMTPDAATVGPDIQQMQMQMQQMMESMQNMQSGGAPVFLSTMPAGSTMPALSKPDNHLPADISAAADADTANFDTADASATDECQSVGDTIRAMQREKKELAARATATRTKAATLSSSIARTETQLAVTKVYLCFLLDCTCSMGPWMQQAQEKLDTIVTEAQDRFNCTMHVAFVGYRDYESNKDRLESYDFVAEAELPTLRAQIQQCEEGSGVDFPEDVTGGLHAAANLSWPN
jgi:hypothetical protein